MIVRILQCLPERTNVAIATMHASIHVWLDGRLWPFDWGAWFEYTDMPIGFDLPESSLGEIESFELRKGYVSTSNVHYCLDKELHCIEVGDDKLLKAVVLKKICHGHEESTVYRAYILTEDDGTPIVCAHPRTF